jgi:hypothetical protein
LSAIVPPVRLRTRESHLLASSAPLQGSTP